MTWRNHAVMTGESKSLLEARTQRYVTAAAGADLVLSGRYRGFLDYATNYCSIALPSWTSLRAGFWSLIAGIETPIQPFVFINGTSTLGFAVVVDFASNLIGFDEAGSTYRPSADYEYVPLAKAPVAKQSEWVHHSIVAKATSLTYRVNGQVVATASNPNYGLNITRLGIMRMSSGDVLGVNIDDLYVDTSSSDELDTAPPPLRFFNVPLRSDGPQAEWTIIAPAQTNAAAVEVYAPTDTATYLCANSTGLRATFEMGPLGVPACYTVAGVGAHVYCDQDARAIELGVELDGTYASNTDLQTNVLTSAGYAAPGRYEMREPDGSPWTINKISRCHVGVRSK